MYATIAILLSSAQPAVIPPGELSVPPYEMSDANADARPFGGESMFESFGGHDGISRIVEGMLSRSEADPRIADVFRGTDRVRTRRTLKEQFCYLLGGGCTYTGRDMKAAHKHMGLQHADMNALVEHLQAAMSAENIPFRLQNRFLSKLAPMRGDVVER